MTIDTARCETCKGKRRVQDDELGAYWPCPDCTEPAPSAEAITRYYIAERDSNGDFDAHMVPAKDGAWVRYEDHIRALLPKEST